MENSKQGKRVKVAFIVAILVYITLNIFLQSHTPMSVQVRGLHWFGTVLPILLILGVVVGSEYEN